MASKFWAKEISQVLCAGGSQYGHGKRLSILYMSGMGKAIGGCWKIIGKRKRAQSRTSGLRRFLAAKEGVDQRTIREDAIEPAAPA
jgi:hypothetical protein